MLNWKAWSLTSWAGGLQQMAWSSMETKLHQCFFSLGPLRNQMALKHVISRNNDMIINWIRTNILIVWLKSWEVFLLQCLFLLSTPLWKTAKQSILRNVESIFNYWTVVWHESSISHKLFLFKKYMCKNHFKLILKSILQTFICRL